MNQLIHLPVFYPKPHGTPNRSCPTCFRYQMSFYLKRTKLLQKSPRFFTSILRTRKETLQPIREYLNGFPYAIIFRIQNHQSMLEHILLDPFQLQYCSSVQFQYQRCVRRPLKTPDLIVLTSVIQMNLKSPLALGGALPYRPLKWSTHRDDTQRGRKCHLLQ